MHRNWHSYVCLLCNMNQPINQMHTARKVCYTQRNTKFRFSLFDFVDSSFVSLWLCRLLDEFRCRIWYGTPLLCCKHSAKAHKHKTRNPRNNNNQMNEDNNRITHASKVFCSVFISKFLFFLFVNFWTEWCCLFSQRSICRCLRWCLLCSMPSISTNFRQYSMSSSVGPPSTFSRAHRSWYALRTWMFNNKKKQKQKDEMQKSVSHGESSSHPIKY